jgi:methyl-accepting chemotaxis protein
MKSNEPVTGKAIPVNPNTVLVSKTDTKGVITYANQAFVEVGGFSEAELLGQSHNLVRHPDMPPAVFAELWETIAAGRPWTGIIKNRARNGDHYWVEANVAPVLRNGVVDEYLSVRRGATPEQIAAAEERYRRLNAGQPPRRSWLGRLNFLNRIPLGAQLAIAIVALLIPFVYQLAVYWSTQSDRAAFSAKESTGVEYVVPLRQLAQQLANHRSAAAAVRAGARELQPEMAAAARGVDQAFGATTLTAPAYVTELAVDDRLERIRAEWRDLEAVATRLPPAQGFARHSELLEAVRALISHVGDTSNLILDPDLDSFYLMEAVIVSLPPALEKLDRVRARGIDHAGLGALDDDARLELRILHNSIDELLERIRNGLAVSARENPAIAARFQPQFEAFAGHAHAFTDWVDQRLIAAAQPAVTPSELFALGTQAVDSGFALYDALTPVLTQLLRDRVNGIHGETYWALGFALVFSIVALALAATIVRRTSGPLRQALAAFADLANGDFTTRIDAGGRRDEIGHLLDGLKVMQTKLNFDLTDAEERAAAATRVKTALDCVSTNVMVADKDYNIIFLNKAVREMFKAAASDLQERLPDFDAGALLGRNIDLFHRDPGHQRRLLDQLTQTHDSRVTVGSRTFRIIANPVIDQAGERLGVAVEWADLTQELRAQEEERIRLEAERRTAAENQRIRVALDNVSTNVMLADTERNIIYVNKAAHSLFDAAEADIRQDLPAFSAANLVGGSIDAFHQNPDHQARLLTQLTQTHVAEMQLGGRTLKIVANPVLDADGTRLGTTVEWTDRTAEVAVEQEIDDLVDAARGGDLQRRIELAGKQGFFRRLGVGFNALLDELAGVFGSIAEVMSRLAEGDLSHDIRQEYAGTFGQVRDDINRTVAKLGQIVGELRTAADQVQTGASEISDGNTNLSARTEQQASSLQETASSLEQLTSTVRNNADNAQQANQVAANARQLAERGGTVVGNAIQAMDQINTASAKIAEIIGVIDEIAFQTNLLALNASVEAARAGEQGRGFAVVATEVRNLAGRSATAAKQIKELIQDSVSKVQAGAELVNESGETLGEIVSGVKKVGDIIAEIAAASAEQAAGIDQVNQAVTAMDEVTQQNAALAEQTSAASASLYDKAQEMERIMAFFHAPEDPAALLHDLEHAGPVAQSAAPQSAELDFFAARTAHMAWRQKIRDFLDGNQALTRAEAVSHRDCALGKWLYSTGLDSYGHVPEMQRMEQEHERLHGVIRDIIELKNDGQATAAEKRFGQIESLSDSIVHLLKSVESKVAN